MLKRTLILILLLATPGFAGEVIKLGKKRGYFAASHGDSRPWKLEDRVCVYRGSSEIGCGEVIKVGSGGAIVKMRADADADVEVGDTVAKKKSKRSLASAELEDDFRAPRKGGQRNQLGVGMYASFGFFFPELLIQHAFSDRFAVGIMPTYLKATGDDISVSGFGLFLTGTYYPNGYLKGLFAQGGVGSFFLTSTIESLGVEEKASPLAVEATVGFSGGSKSGFTYNLAVGLSYMKEPFPALELKAANVKPLGIFTVGYAF